MRRYGLLLMILILAVTSLLAAAAYNVATVTSAATLKIVATNGALLQLRDPAGQAGPVGNKDATYKIVNGEMVITFGMGVGRDGSSEVEYGLQPNSVYEFNPLFTIANMSADTYDITVTASSALASYITFGNMGQVGGGTFPPIWGTQGAPLTFTNVTKESGSGLQNVRSVAVRVTVPSGTTLATISGTIIVSALAK